MKNRLRELCYRLTKNVISFIFKIYYRPRFINIDIIPRAGALILIGNSIHLLDLVLIVMSTKRPIRCLVKKDFYVGPYIFLFKMLGFIKYDESVLDNRTQKTVLKTLQRGEGICVFTTDMSNNNSTFYRDVAKKTDACILPFVINGKYHFWKTDLSIAFALPIKIGNNEDLETTNKRLQKSIEGWITKNR